MLPCGPQPDFPGHRQLASTVGRRKLSLSFRSEHLKVNVWSDWALCYARFVCNYFLRVPKWARARPATETVKRESMISVQPQKVAARVSLSVSLFFSPQFRCSGRPKWWPIHTDQRLPSAGTLLPCGFAKNACIAVANLFQLRHFRRASKGTFNKDSLFVLFGKRNKRYCETTMIWMQHVLRLCSSKVVAVVAPHVPSPSRKIFLQ